MMDRATSRQYSMCSLLFLMTFSSVYNQEFSTNVNAWVDHCVLHTNYTEPAGNGTCSAYKYRVRVNMYTKDNKKMPLSSTDTNDLKYSYNGINSSTRYGIEVTPALQCRNRDEKHDYPFGEISTKNVTALAEISNQVVQAAEAVDLSISCPFHGAYKSYTVIKWQHKLGINKTMVRNFTTATVNLVHITYEDSGMYYCTVKYYPCGSNSQGPMYKEGLVSVNFEGPPVIASVVRTTEGDNISLTVLVVSFPQPPRPTITLANENGHKVKVNSSGFVPVVFQYPAYGQSVKVSGYETKITIRNMSVEWLGEIKVFVTNGHGTTTSGDDNQEFSTNVNAWVDHCVLHTNYTEPAGNGTCLAYKYRVRVNMYTKDNIKMPLSSTDTNDLKYSYNGINSSTRYGIEVTPALQCRNRDEKHDYPFGEISTKNVTALAETSPQTVLAAEAQDLSISCPFHGAYKSYTVIKWQHRLGTNNTVIRNFTTARVNLVHITYDDSGKYYCKVEYYPCGSKSQGPMYKEGFVSVNFEGPPVIASVMRTTERDNISLIVLVVSFPEPPWPTITLANGNGHRIEVNSSGFVPVVFQYTTYGQSVTVNGYQTKITIRNSSVEWLGEIKVFVTNRHGTQEYTVTTTSDDREKKKTLETFFNENKPLVYGVGAGFLTLFSLGIAVLIGCNRNRKKKLRRGFNVNDTQEEDVDCLALVDELYAKPFENKLYEDPEEKVPDREKRIQMERMQIASTYSFGGFSINEFEYEEAAYGNDPGQNYNNVPDTSL